MRFHAFSHDVDKYHYTPLCKLTDEQVTRLLNISNLLTVIAAHDSKGEVQFYATQLNLTPKHFSKVIRIAANGLSPADWIEQYIIAQAKRMIEARPAQTHNQKPCPPVASARAYLL